MIWLFWATREKMILSPHTPQTSQRALYHGFYDCRKVGMLVSCAVKFIAIHFDWNLSTATVKIARIFSSKCLRKYLGNLNSPSECCCCCTLYKLRQLKSTNSLNGHEISLIVYFVMSCLCLVSHRKKARLVCISEMVRLCRYSEHFAKHAKNS